MSKAAARSDELLKDITKMMTDPSAASDDNKITDVMDRIRDLDSKKASDEVRLAACHFMTMYHTRKAMTIGMNDQQQGGGGPGGMGGIPPAPPMDPFGMGGPPSGSANAIGGPGGQSGQGAPGSPNDLVNYEAVEKFKEDQRKDMLLGWKLLDIRGGNSQTARTARVLRIEVAQRLEDSEKLKEAFDDLMKRNLTEEEVMVAFTAAPFLGDWKSMMKLGRRIEKMPGGLEQLHMMSLQLPIPDFTVVYDLAKQHSLEKRKAPKPSTLPWDLLNVSKIRVKFKDVNCGQFEEKREELLQEIKKQGDIEWEDVPTVSHVHVKRMGALCQAVSFGEIPMMLNGPWLEGRIHVKGRAEMPLMPEDGSAMMNPYGMPSMDQMTILIQEEEWDLKQDNNNNNNNKNKNNNNNNSNEKNKNKNNKNNDCNDDQTIVYSGKYTLNQRPQLPPNKKITPEHAPVNMEFECQVFLTPSNELNDKNNKNKNKNNKKNKNSNSNDSNNDNSNGTDGNDNSINDEKVDDTVDDVDPIVTEFDGLELD